MKWPDANQETEKGRVPWGEIACRAQPPRGSPWVPLGRGSGKLWASVLTVASLGKKEERHRKSTCRIG